MRRWLTTLQCPSCTWWATSEHRWRAGASLQPTGRPPGDSHGSRSLCWRRVYVTVTFPYGAAHGCRRLPLLEAGAGGFLASPASRGVGIPSRHLGGSMRAALGRSERAPPPPGLGISAQRPSAASLGRPVTADFELWGGRDRAGNGVWARQRAVLMCRACGKPAAAGRPCSRGPGPRECRLREVFACKRRFPYL